MVSPMQQEYLFLNHVSCIDKQPLMLIQFCTIGNHEYYTSDVDNWIQELPKLNVTPLMNKRVCLLARDPETCGGGLYLAGLEDIETRRMK